eukprot:GHVS01101851.1.p1 GENE.GHVS01101851.1~~GHVS01101851.1.p1  ORF type:complete len:453 (+),score=55.70 GHVS01101851.1:142-1500(+)
MCAAVATTPTTASTAANDASCSSNKYAAPRSIAVVHLDLGMGGAEQLIAHAAVGLRRRGHNVQILTTFYDRERAPPACKEMDIVEVARWFPRTVMGRFTAICSVIRIFILALYMLYKGGCSYDVIMVDQVSALNPLFARMCQKLMFYCHFPDKLLCPTKTSLIHSIYRFWLDLFEGYSTGVCDNLLVNSHFTQAMLKQTFPTIMKPSQVVYPPVDLSDVSTFLYDVQSISNKNFPQLAGVDDRSPIFLSVNRFERKKNIQVAIRAFGRLCEELESLPANRKLAAACKAPPVLIISGGWDERLRENREYFSELQQLTTKDGRFNMSQVLFLRSIPSQLRWYLMYVSTAVVYTPHEEHFGMVPCEAMSVGARVVAVNSGGPRETVLDGETGYLCDPTEESFAVGMKEALRVKLLDPRKCEKMRNSGIEQVQKNFSLDAFIDRLSSILDEPTRTA